MSIRILRLPAVRERTGLSRSSIYAFMSANEFPRQLKLGDRAAGWLESEVDEWITARVEKSRSAA
jgi:prophage regulatory protein